MRFGSKINPNAAQIGNLIIDRNDGRRCERVRASKETDRAKTRKGTRAVSTGLSFKHVHLLVIAPRDIRVCSSHFKSVFRSRLKAMLACIFVYNVVKRNNGSLNKD